MHTPTYYSEYIKCLGGYRQPFNPNDQHVIGVLTGEGVGAEVVPVALSLLEILFEHSNRKFIIHHGGLIGYPAKEKFGVSLSSETINFTKSIFEKKGALFCGPGGERFVYELRKEFKLYCKFTPIEPLIELNQSGSVRSNIVNKTNMVMVRENLGGIYQGRWSEEVNEEGEMSLMHSFSYTKTMVEEILKVAFKLAENRQNRLHVVLKPGGIPTISDLWWKCAKTISIQYPMVKLFLQEIDNAVYQLIADPAQFDVVVSPNLFGDVLADCASLLLSSRGLSYSGNFDANGNGVYQTGHGAARDIAGKNVANPIGQIFSLGMMLRESFHWPEADYQLLQAVRATLRSGMYTSDIAPPGHAALGTREFGVQIANNLKKQLNGILL